ncbi:MAG: hypothetical protein C4523_09450 [Myxococcales bacterium]|nr:MAG: hypothetical protein C4523_09450 [Myxococcales bacterium]
MPAGRAALMGPIDVTENDKSIEVWTNDDMDGYQLASVTVQTYATIEDLIVALNTALVAIDAGFEASLYIPTSSDAESIREDGCHLRIDYSGGVFRVRWPADSMHEHLGFLSSTTTNANFHMSSYAPEATLVAEGVGESFPQYPAQSTQTLSQALVTASTAIATGAERYIKWHALNELQCGKLREIWDACEANGLPAYFYDNYERAEPYAISHVVRFDTRRQRKLEFQPRQSPVSGLYDAETIMVYVGGSYAPTIIGGTDSVMRESWISKVAGATLLTTECDPFITIAASPLVGAMTLTLPEMSAGTDGTVVKVVRFGEYVITIEDFGSATVLLLLADREAVKLKYRHAITEWVVVKHWTPGGVVNVSTTPYTIDVLACMPNTVHVVDSSGDAIAASLPEAPADGTPCAVQCFGANGLTLSPSGADTIDGAASFALSDGDALSLVYDAGAADWRIV